MKDSYNREIQYLRLSLTARCNLACLYCKQGKTHALTDKEITQNEVGHVMDSMLELGISKVRLTGGEPLLRPDLEDIVAALKYRADDICLTTNAHGLSSRAAGLKRAGLSRVNISLDTLNPDTYERITRGGNLSLARAGIDAAIEHKLAPVKLNCVLIRGLNDTEIDSLIGLTARLPVHVRFIELMPMGALGDDKRVDTAEILKARPELKALKHTAGAAAREYRIEGHMGTVGFISPVTKRFCHECTRIRVTSDMKLKPCLGSDMEFDLRGPLREGRLTEAIRAGIQKKPKGHDFNESHVPSRGMSEIGG